jgi:hypothetical protein
MGTKLWTMAKDQSRAIGQAKGTQDSTNHSQTTIRMSDEVLKQPYFVYVYNILNRSYRVEAPPHFTSFHIPACLPGEKFAFNKLGAYLLEAYEKPGTFEISYTKVDGRRVATSLLNPAAFPGTAWESQLQNWKSDDQFGNNLNSLGVFWSLTEPDDLEHLEPEIALFRERATKTMNELIRQGELFAAAQDLKSISPLMHFAMDYFGKQAAWHMASEHKISCPHCGELVREGIAYHRNSMGEKCIIDVAKYKILMRRQAEVDAELAAGLGFEEGSGEPAKAPVKKAPARKTA